jgi:hypothetical protein
MSTFTDRCIKWYWFPTRNLQSIQKNTQQFETRVTMEWRVGKVKGGTTGCGNVRVLQPSKERALCKTTPPHTGRGLLMKPISNFHSCIISFCTLEIYAYTVHQNCCPWCSQSLSHAVKIMAFFSWMYKRINKSTSSALVVCLWSTVTLF